MATLLAEGSFRVAKLLHPCRKPPHLPQFPLAHNPWLLPPLPYPLQAPLRLRLSRSPQRFRVPGTNALARLLALLKRLQLPLLPELQAFVLLHQSRAPTRIWQITSVNVERLTLSNAQLTDSATIVSIETFGWTRSC
jgi:hypothetical protein